jgi:flagellar biosynthetic protein FlhB
MAEQSAAERTEYPTSKRLSKARQKGQVPYSQELVSAALLAAMVAAIFFLTPSMMRWFITQTQEGLVSSNSVFADARTFTNFANGKIIDFIIITCPVFAAIVVGSLGTCLAISGPNYAPEALRFKLEAINPVNGLQNLMNAKTAVHLLVSILKLVFVSVIVWLYLKKQVYLLANLRWAWSGQIVTVIGRIILGMMIRVCIALVVIGIADVVYQKYKYIESLKMTRQEVKDERKEYEGAPEVKTRIRRIQYAVAMKRMLHEVPKASVVLVNPTHVAVALRYEAETMEAPVMVAKGADHLAEKIREIARAYGVPIIRRPELARTIFATVKIGSAIPETLYVAVAEILAMIYRLRHRK